MNIPAARFKAECLRLMDRVEKTREPVFITKHGRAVAQLAPLPAEPSTLFGYMRNTLTVSGDVVAPLEAEWSALSGDEDHLFMQPRASRPRRKK